MKALILNSPHEHEMLEENVTKKVKVEDHPFFGSMLDDHLDVCSQMNKLRESRFINDQKP